MPSKKGTTMSEVQTNEAPKKTRRKPQGPRQTKPVFLIVRYTDEDGTPVKLDKSRLSIENTKDAAQVVELVTSGDASATVVTIKVESEARPSPAA
jgi:hypothetical protein